MEDTRTHRNERRKSETNVREINGLRHIDHWVDCRHSTRLKWQNFYLRKRREETHIWVIVGLSDGHIDSMCPLSWCKNRIRFEVGENHLNSNQSIVTFWTEQRTRRKREDFSVYVTSDLRGLDHAWTFLCVSASLNRSACLIHSLSRLDCLARIVCNVTMETKLWMNANRDGWHKTIMETIDMEFKSKPRTERQCGSYRRQR